MNEAMFTEKSAEARTLGYERGKSVGSWVIDGNTSDDTARDIIAGYENGDPSVMDMAPSPLSGEWADDPTIGDVLRELDTDEGDDAADDLLSEYEVAFSDGFWDEVISSADAVLSEDQE